MHTTEFHRTGLVLTLSYRARKKERLWKIPLEKQTNSVSALLLPFHNTDKIRRHNFNIPISAYLHSFQAQLDGSSFQ